MKLRKPVVLIIILILAVQLACNWPGRATPTPDTMDLINPLRRRPSSPN